MRYFKCIKNDRNLTTRDMTANFTKCLTIGKIYTVEDSDVITHSEMIRIEDDNKKVQLMNIHRFEEVAGPDPEPEPTIFKTINPFKLEL